ncbi:hypothetical protein L1887_51777 [Cichorium endivia]|nr:hypothetical protein L1887_51777 [Cichorium endivia]
MPFWLQQRLGSLHVRNYVPRGDDRGNLISLGEFKSYEAKLHVLLKNTEPANINPPQQLKSFIEITHEKGASLESAVARRLLSRLDLASDQRMIMWHPKYFLWSIFVDAEFSQDEIYSLYCVLSFNGVDHGAERLARRMFNEGLEALSEDEMAIMASILWSPSRYMNNMPALTARKNYLISRNRDTGR